MKQYLEIKSFGEIDTKAFTLIGASTKRDDETAIGLFGSGACYSIAALIRKNIEFFVFSGEDQINFTTIASDFRGQAFEQILVNGQHTSLTTTMGGNDWDSAFAPIREIYSNALDEDKDATLKSTVAVSPEKGYTKFYIEMVPDVAHFYKNLHLYFCTANPKVLYSNDSGSVYENTDSGRVRIFRKGILVHSDEKMKSLFHYNCPEIEINESRVAANSTQIIYHPAVLLKSCTDVNIINSLLIGMSGSNTGLLEHDLYWDNWRNFSPAWSEACQGRKLAPIEYLSIFEDSEVASALLLPISLLRPLKAKFPELNILGLSSKKGEVFFSAKPSQILVDKVVDAVGVLKGTRYGHRLTQPVIEYVKFSDDSILGMAQDGTIYLSTKLDCSSVPEIAKIIIEENEHNITGYQDKTRAFQNHLFNIYYDELIS